ncbi:MAG: hypothetical protein RJA99_3193 [Pseudomonadota bacterium]|jgi:hypothetical protein
MKRKLQEHANEEAKALRRGGASKQLMAEEREEYAKKGVKFASGGSVKARMTAKSHGKACR